MNKKENIYYYLKKNSQLISVKLFEKCIHLEGKYFYFGFMDLFYSLFFWIKI